MTLARLDHAHIIGVLGAHKTDTGTAYIIMEQLTGAPLSRLVETCGAGTPVQIARFIRQMTSALAATHRLGLVHRDLKLENVFMAQVAEPGVFDAKLLDFGVVKPIGTERLTQDGQLVGTLHYMSPEQILGREIDQRSDLYSFALVCLETLIGKRLFAGQADAAVLSQILDEHLPPLSQLLPSAPPELDQAFAAALAKKPEQRPSSLEEWGRLVADRIEPMTSEAPGWRYDPTRPTRDRLSSGEIERVTAVVQREVAAR
jgi:serine/threonine-protein kinase